MISQNTETMKRDEGDYKSCSLNITNRSQSNNFQSDITNSNMDETLSLSIQSQDQMDLNLEDIISLYEQIDYHIFDNKEIYDIIFSEKAFYCDINQIENQRIILQQNSQSTIYSGFISNTRQLIIQKLIQVDCQEIMIQKLDEYKIHYVINQQYPRKSLQLITPVCIKKHEQKYQLLANMEKASFNLYDYSRKYDITSEQAYYIFITISQQIKSLHQLKIAHRDVKPQNILYVQDKGWVLSDFGESQEYNDIESYYNIRGTKYFLPYSISLQINKSIKIQQNLLKNDLYALVVSIIIIQKKDHLLNIEQEIKNLELGNYLQTVLSFKSLEQLIIFYDNLPKIQNNVEFQTTQSIYKIMTPYEERCNIIATQQSWFSLYYFYSYNQINLELSQQILQLITQKQQTYLPIILGLNQNKRSKNTNPLVLAKKRKMDYQICNFLFLSGYNEKTIQYAKQSLLNSYNQKTHMILILTYQRSFMFEEASQEINLFIQGLKFDQLENELQQHLFLLLNNQRYFNFNHFNIKFNLNEQLNKQNIYEEYIFQNLNNIISQNNNQLSNKNIDELFYLIKQVCMAFTPINLKFYSNIMYQIQISLSIDIYKMIVKKVILQNFQLLDLNRKTILIYDLGQTEFLLNQENLRQSAKQFQQLILISESKEQIITFQIIRLALKVFQFKANFNQYLNEIRILIKNINPINFALYKQFVVSIIYNLIYTVQQFYRNQQSCNLIFLVEYCIPQAYKELYLKEQQKEFIIIHRLGLWILFDLQNYKRCLKLEKDYENIGLEKYQRLFFKYNQFKNRKWDEYFSSQEGRSRQFQLWQYLNVQ